MKKYFFTGLITLLPFALTIIIVVFFINLLTSPFQGMVQAALDYYDIFDSPFLIFSGKQVLLISSKLLALAAIFCCIILMGFLAKMLIMNTLIRFGEIAIQRIPLINVIYKGTKEIIKSLFESKGTTFSQVALAPYPHSEAYSFALVSNEQSTNSKAESISIFIPTTPNPTIGYMLMIKKEELIFIDMKVEDAIKCIVSCGIMFPEFQAVPAFNEFQDISAK